MGFAEDLRTKVKTDHDKSDKIFNAALSIALTDRKVYRMAVYRFWRVFQMLEEKMDDLRDGCPHLQQVYFPSLFRAEEFEEDVEFFFEGDVPEDIKSPALEEYRKQLENDVTRDPVLLIGYMQTMQMALVSGGAMLRPMIVRVLGLKDRYPLGVKALDWPEGFSTTAAKKLYTERLDALELTPEQQNGIITAKRGVFSLNNKLIREVIYSTESRDVLLSMCKKVSIVCLIFMFLAIAYLFYLS